MSIIIIIQDLIEYIKIKVYPAFPKDYSNFLHNYNKFS